MMIAATDSECPGTRMTDAQLRDQSVTILTAGHETTANAMTFTLYLLAKHPAEQTKLRAEIQSVLGAADPAVEKMDRLVRTRWVLSESMRLYPPAWTMGRQNRREVTLGGFRLPPKCTILIPQWTLHRDPRFFPDPPAFNPDRWQNPVHPRFAYIPFSTGPRNCIGESFAWLEMMLALPLLVRDFEFSLPAQAEEIKLTPAITLRPRGPVMVCVQPLQSR
jgi:cytochrome P450